MPARLHPGVYVEEVPSGARAVEGVGTSTTIFIGDAERGPLEPTKIKGIGDYERQFGGYRRFVTGTSTPCRLRYAIDAFFSNGGSSAYVLRAPEAAIVPATASRADVSATAQLVASSPGAWANRYGVAFADSSDGTAGRFRIFVTYTAPASAAVVVERFDRLSFDPKDENYVVDVLARSWFVRWDPAAAVPAPGTPVTRDLPAGPVTDQIAAANTVLLGGGLGGESALTTAAYGPALFNRLNEVTDASLLVVVTHDGASNLELSTVQTAGLAYAEARPKQDLFTISDMPRGTVGVSATTATTNVVESFNSVNPPVNGSYPTKTNFGAVYFPWVEVTDPVGVGRDPTIMLGPAPFVAGLFARTDQRRGVWKAPAGLEATLLGVRRIEHKLLDVHQDDLNPIGINALRPMPQGGNVVWGSRTMQPASEWRYIPVRRTAIFLRTSIYNGIQWAVFEPNDQQLWNNLRLTIGAFMDQLYRQGAFAGRTSRDAYFVKCDEETTPEADRIAGIVNVWVGFAPQRPAEFVVVQLRQIVNQRA